VTLSIWQKLEFSVVRFFIKSLYFFDYLAQVTSGRLLYRVVYTLSLLILISGTVFLGFSLVFQSHSLQKTSSLLQTGIVSNIYGVPGYQPPVPDKVKNVMGAESAPLVSPVLTKKIAFPFIDAKAHLIVDNNTGKILNEHNDSVVFAPASVTKLMTALVARETYHPDDYLTVNDDCTKVESTKLWLPAGDSFKFEDLMYGLLVSSAGDVACTMASSHYDREHFIELMNEKAAKLGMKNTHFTNEIGLDGTNGSHYSTAWDLYLLTREALKDPLIKKIVRTKNYTFTDQSGDLEVNVINTNKLLWDIPHTVGVKTGTTSGAGEVLIYEYQEGVKDITIIVLSSEDRFTDTRNLLNWVLNSYQWQ
jgi:D-alanyl-D-alanine carboxypeptidase (penicillin-binding protein 5/6)